MKTSQRRFWITGIALLALTAGLSIPSVGRPQGRPGTPGQPQPGTGSNRGVQTQPGIQPLPHIVGGYLGNSGFVGMSGLNGNAGFNGFNGFSGFSGFNGFGGFSGFNGFTFSGGVAGFGG